jgi:peptidoglycan/LPS O-acetylase OafA/YrhL
MAPSDPSHHNSTSQPREVDLHPEGMKQITHHFYWLNWLRFLAAFLVLVCHSRGSTWVEYVGLDDRQKGWLAWTFFACTRAGLEAVVVFFVMSGFLVGGKTIERILNGTFNISLYTLDRLTRVYIPLVPALVLAGIVATKQGSPLKLSEFMGNIAGMQGVFCKDFAGNLPLWSLAYEIWFYLLAGFVAIVITRPDKYVSVGLIASGIALAIFTILNPAFLFCWAIGALSYFLLSVELGKGILVFGLILSTLGLGLSQFISDSKSLAPNDFLSNFLSRDQALLILGLGLAMLLPIFAKTRPQSPSLLRFEAMGSRLASFSYTLYLTHYPLLGLWNHLPGYHRFAVLDVDSFLWFGSKIGISLIVGFLFYLPFEAQTNRARKWLHRIFHRHQTSPSTA